MYPPNLPLTSTIETSTHSILHSIRTTLLPGIPAGDTLTCVRDRLEVMTVGSRVDPQQRIGDGRIATLIVVLPSRFRGGALVVRDLVHGRVDKIQGKKGKSSNDGIEWHAFLADDCEYEVEDVDKGCRLTLSYGVYVKPAPVTVTVGRPLVTPSDSFLDSLSPVLNLFRGQTVAMFLEEDYGISPAELTASALTPIVCPRFLLTLLLTVSQLKGGDNMLFQALRIFNITPELRWTAGGYIWNADRVVDLTTTSPVVPSSHSAGTPYQFLNHEQDLRENSELRERVERSGAIPLQDSGVGVLQDWEVSVKVRSSRAHLNAYL